MTTYAYDHAQRTSTLTTKSSTNRASLSLLMCSLSLLCSLLLSACASRPPQRGAQLDQDATLTLTLRPWLDLTARQRLNEAWLTRLTQAVNAHLAPLKVRLQLGATSAWSLGDEARGASLESLRPALLAELKTNEREREVAKEGEGSTPRSTLWLAINSFPPPSYPRLQQLALGSRGEPLIALRDLRSVSGVSVQEAERAMARLLAREVARALGALEGCEPDAMSLKRDALLGWRSRAHAADTPHPSPQASPQASPQRASLSPSRLTPPVQRGARARSADRFEGEGDLPPPPLTWSERNRRLVALSVSARSPFQGALGRACERLEVLSLGCEAHLAPARLSTHACLTTPQAWVEASKIGRLSPSAWDEERRLARGLERYLKGAWGEALSLCEPIASFQPSSLASLCAGVAAAELKRDELATRYLRAHLAAHPQEPTATLTLSKVLGRGGEHRAAEALLASLLNAELHPNERARALYNLGVARAQQGRWGEALEAWRSIEEGASEHKKAQPLIQEALRLTQARPQQPQPR